MFKGVEIYKNVYIGSKFDYEDSKLIMSRNQWSVIHACKTYHKMILKYPKNCDKNSPYYYFYKNYNELYLNMIDVPNPNFFNDGMMIEAIRFGIEALNDGKRLYIHCDQGNSRAPMLGLLILKYAGYLNDMSFDEAYNWLETKYPYLNPGEGIYIYCQNNWDDLSI